MATLTERHGKVKAKVELETQLQNEISDWARDASTEEIIERWGQPTQYDGWQIWRGSRTNKTWLSDISYTDEDQWCYHYSPGAFRPVIEQQSDKTKTRQLRWVVG